MNEHTITEGPTRSLRAEDSSAYGELVVSDGPLLGRVKTWHDGYQRIRLITNVRVSENWKA